MLHSNKFKTIKFNEIYAYLVLDDYFHSMEQKSLLVFLLLCLIGQNSLAQKNNSFSGELTYKITKVDASMNPLSSEEDNSENKVIIYAKDSLLKIVNFNSQNGYQECLKHMTRKKSILLLEIDDKGYAIRMNDEQSRTKDSLYSFRNKCGVKKRIGGLKSKKTIMNHPMLANELICFYSKTIPSRYANEFSGLSGIPTLYYIVNDDGLYRYVLKSHRSYDPPLSMFLIPEEYEIVTMDEFIEKVNSDN